MTQVFDETGRAEPVTVIKVDENIITQIKKSATDGYEAVQLATGDQNDNRLTKAEIGQRGGTFRYGCEFRLRQPVDDLAPGDILDAGLFSVGDLVTVSATSKGKGFQGVVKRHNFKGGRKSHGQKHSHREPGSIGATGPARVFKGTRMGGRMGGTQVTVKNLRVIQVNAGQNLLLIRGAVPGRKGSLVKIHGNY